MSKQETIADIIAELRNASNGACSGMVMVDAKKYADRIEAAVVKEKSEINQREISNASAMREALEELRHRLVYFCARTDNRYDPPWAEELIGIINVALSAPARNCDLFLTLKDAMLAHLEEVYEGEKVEFGDYEWCEFVKWLFAKAKGETK